MTLSLSLGLAGLVAVPPLLQGMDVVESTERTLTIKATLVIWNPSTITAALGEVSFLWAFNGHLIGLAAVPNGNILPGNNTIECIGVLDPSIDCSRKKDPRCDPELAKSATRQFISKYISGKNKKHPPNPHDFFFISVRQKINRI